MRRGVNLLAGVAAVGLVAGCGDGSVKSAGATLAPYTPGSAVASAVESEAAASSSAADASFSAAASASSAAAASSSAAYAAAHPSYSSDEVRQKVGQPCSPDRLLATAYGYSTWDSLPGKNGMICIGGTWAIIAETNSGCELYGEAPWAFATQDGTRLECVNDTLYLQGQPLSGPIYVGDYKVGTGTGELSHGTYVATDVKNCYWERLDANGNIIDNNFINAAPRAQVTVRSSDYAVNFEGCGGWVRQ